MSPEELGLPLTRTVSPALTAESEVVVPFWVIVVVEPTRTVFVRPTLVVTVIRSPETALTVTVTPLASPLLAPPPLPEPLPLPGVCCAVVELVEGEAELELEPQAARSSPVTDTTAMTASHREPPRIELVAFALKPSKLRYM